MSSGSVVPQGMFCAHKRLRTACPECRPPPPPAPEPKPAAAKRARSADGDDEESAPTRAPVKRRTRVKAPTRAEAENAEAWWVKKD